MSAASGKILPAASIKTKLSLTSFPEAPSQRTMALSVDAPGPMTSPTGPTPPISSNRTTSSAAAGAVPTFIV